jgi:hypothetical protein
MVPAVSVLRASGMCPADIFAQFDEPPPIRGHRAVAQWFARLLQARRICECEPEAIAVQFLGGLISRHALRHTLGDRFPDGGPRYIESLAGTLWAALQPHSEASP